MKTRHILTAIALPALLAACTQDELVEVNNQPDFNGVPTVEASFTATKGGVDTKMATQFGWQKDDKIGLGWLGDGTEVGASNTDGKIFYDNPLFCYDPENGYFNVNTMLPVGKYVAYMPYAEMTAPGNIKFSIEGQPLTTNLGDIAKRFIYIDPKLANLVELAEGEQLDKGESEAGVNKNIQLNMVRLSNALTLNLNFANVAKLEGLKVTGVAINIASSGNPTLMSSFDYKAQDVKKDGVQIEAWSELSGQALAESSNGYVANPKANGLVLTSEEGLALTNNALTVYATMLPSWASSLEGCELAITVSTNYGDVTIDGDNETLKVYNGANATRKEVEGGWTKAPIFTGLGQSGSIDVTVDGEEITMGAAKVATQAQLETLLETLATSGQKDAVTITLDPANPVAKAFTLKDFTMPENLAAPITLTSAKTIAFEGENNVINKPLTVTGNDIQLKGNMVVKNCVNAKGDQITTLTVGTMYVNANAVLTNEGAMAGAMQTNPVVKQTDEAGLYISATADATFSASIFTNAGEIQWIAGTLPTVSSGDGAVFAEIEDADYLADADAAGVTTARIDGASLTTLGDLMLDNIVTIECSNDVALDITKQYGKTATITMSALTTIVMEKGASLTITSDDKTNKLDITKGDVALTVPEGSTLSMSKVTVGTNEIQVTNHGTVTLDTVTGVTEEAGSDGTWTKK